VEANESAIEAGQREVVEETGYRTTDHRRVHSYYPMSGIANKVVHIVHCRAVECVGGFDRDEISEVCWFSKEEVWRMIERGEMTDGLSLVALLLCLR